jgi:hypothetical protein
MSPIMYQFDRFYELLPQEQEQQQQQQNQETKLWSILLQFEPNLDFTGIPFQYGSIGYVLPHTNAIWKNKLIRNWH